MVETSQTLNPMLLRPLFALLIASSLTAAAAEPEVIPLQVRDNLRIVYQVTDDAAYEGVKFE